MQAFHMCVLHRLLHRKQLSLFLAFSFACAYHCSQHVIELLLSQAIIWRAKRSLQGIPQVAVELLRSMILQGGGLY